MLGPDPMVAARAIRVADLNDDGNADIVVGTSYSTQSRLFLGEGNGRFRDATATNLPQIKASVGDVKVGDADGDGDLDLTLADWGPGDPMTNAGGRTMLWLNDGNGRFSDATATHMPHVAVKFSWNLDSSTSTMTTTSTSWSPRRRAPAASCSRTTARAATRT